MNGTTSTRTNRRDCGSKGRRAPRGAIGPGEKTAVAILLLAGSLSCWAGYTVDSRVETAAGTNYYTWTVYNQDQTWGLDGFTIEVPLETRVLTRTLPAPYTNPDSTAYWIMEERHEGQVDAHDGEVNIPAPRPGMKLLVWWGRESPSVYPPGTSVTFSVATDSSVGPGAVRGSAATYTPQHDPHYYLTWLGQVLGPSIGAANISPEGLTGDGHKQMLPVVRSVLVTNVESSVSGQRSTLVGPLPALSIAVHTGLTVEGVVGLQYGIQCNTDLANSDGWRGLANVILTTPKQVWYDPQPASNPQRYYRIVPGPISIP